MSLIYLSLVSFVYSIYLRGFGLFSFVVGYFIRGAWMLTAVSWSIVHLLALHVL